MMGFSAFMMSTDQVPKEMGSEGNAEGMLGWVKPESLSSLGGLSKSQDAKRRQTVTKTNPNSLVDRNAPRQSSRDNRTSMMADDPAGPTQSGVTDMPIPQRRSRQGSRSFGGTPVDEEA